jgi:lambda family phage minor tail protein L
MSILTDLQKPSIGRYVELFIFDVTPLGGPVYRLCNSGQCVFGGQTFMAMPCEGSGWKTSIDGAPPQPTLNIANVSRLLTPGLSQYKQYVGARLTRLQTLDKYLDTGATPDSTQVFNQTDWIVAGADVAKEAIKFKLMSDLDNPSRKFPRGQMLRSEFPGLGLYRR